jgi:hypothetical protein
MSGEHLCSTQITSHDKSILRIEVEELPPSHNIGVGCKLLILTTPTPCEYHGKVVREGKRKAIAMFKGQERELRGSERYTIRLPAMIEDFISDGAIYALYKPLEVELMNISKTGVRFQSPNFSLCDHDRFRLRLRINDKDKLLVAEVVNHLDRDQKKSEYGCRFLTGREGGI